MHVCYEGLKQPNEYFPVAKVFLTSNPKLARDFNHKNKKIKTTNN